MAPRSLMARSLWRWHACTFCLVSLASTTVLSKACTGTGAIRLSARRSGVDLASTREASSIARSRRSQRYARNKLRYGRFYFRPVSGDGRNFGISGFPQGVLTFSRILNDQEVLVVANTNTTQRQELDVIVDIQLSSEGDRFAVLYSNQARPAAPAPVRSVAQGSATVHEVDGSLGQGPLHVVHVKLNPLEAQILRRRTV